VAAFALAESAVAVGSPASLAQLVGSLAFGVGFVFVAGRSELFTEKFLVPIAGLEGKNRQSWLKLGELWAATLVLNPAGGTVRLVAFARTAQAFAASS
jgi:formate/nitrite transporter FocA (FNT family)